MVISYLLTKLGIDSVNGFREKGVLWTDGRTDGWRTPAPRHLLCWHSQAELKLNLKFHNPYFISNFCEDWHKEHTEKV